MKKCMVGKSLKSLDYWKRVFLEHVCKIERRCTHGVNIKGKSNQRGFVDTHQCFKSSDPAFQNPHLRISDLETFCQLKLLTFSYSKSPCPNRRNLVYFLVASPSQSCPARPAQPSPARPWTGLRQTLRTSMFREQRASLEAFQDVRFEPKPLFL